MQPALYHGSFRAFVGAGILARGICLVRSDFRSLKSKPKGVPKVVGLERSKMYANGLVANADARLPTSRDWIRKPRGGGQKSGTLKARVPAAVSFADFFSSARVFGDFASGLRQIVLPYQWSSAARARGSRIYFPYLAGRLKVCRFSVADRLGNHAHLVASFGNHFLGAGLRSRWKNAAKFRGGG